MKRKRAGTLPNRLAVLAGCILLWTHLAPLPVLSQNRPSASKVALPEGARFKQEIEAFLSSDATNPPPKKAILFIGSSSIRLWKNVAADFPKHRVINRGFGGSEISDSIAYAARIVIPSKPRLIVFYAGGNDINGGKTPEIVFEDFKRFAAEVHKSLPRTKIAYISIAGNPARWAQVDRVRKANSLIAQFAKSDKRLAYIDVFNPMLGDDGLPRPNIFVNDRLHMNDQGYAIWKRVVEPFLGSPDRRQAPQPRIFAPARGLPGRSRWEGGGDVRQIERAARTNMLRPGRPRRNIQVQL